jgi:hypothetical protein
MEVGDEENILQDSFNLLPSSIHSDEDMAFASSWNETIIAKYHFCMVERGVKLVN